MVWRNSFLGLTVVLSMLPGCKSVVSDHLIGQPIEAEQAQGYEGVWRVGDSVLHIKHLDGADLRVAGLEWDEDKFKLNQHYVVITGHGEALFAQMVAEDDDDDAAKMDEGGDKPWLLLGLLSVSGDDALVLYGPKFDRFKQALDAGEIQGEVSEDGNTLHIKGDKTALDALVRPDNLHELFQMQNPGVLQRIGDLE